VNPFAEYVEQSATLASAWTKPLRTMLEHQRQQADQMAEWAQRHRELAELVASWAEEQRQLTRQMAAFVEPVLAQTEQMTELTKSWARMFQPPA